MKVLLVKTSSLGDVLHALPAVTDAARAIPDLQFDWVVEEAFQEIPGWHPSVRNVIPVAIRRWRKNWLKTLAGAEWKQFRQSVQRQAYDTVIDAQGLIKSALLARQARGRRFGLNWASAREPLASLSYQQRIPVHWDQHAISRVRSLMAQALDYALPATPPDYGIRQAFTATRKSDPPGVVFLHGTTWPTKHWPESYWVELSRLASDAGFRIRLPWGNEQEKARAERIAGQVAGVRVLPRCSLAELADILAEARAYVAVDTGIGHLAAALDTPGISLYGATDPKRTGSQGRHQQHLVAEFACAPCLKRECSYAEPSTVTPACYASLPPELVWTSLQKLLSTELSIPTSPE